LPEEVEATRDTHSCLHLRLQGQLYLVTMPKIGRRWCCVGLVRGYNPPLCSINNESAQQLALMIPRHSIIETVETRYVECDKMKWQGMIVHAGNYGLTFRVLTGQLILACY
jgi:hypothetical protein